MLDRKFFGKTKEYSGWKQGRGTVGSDALPGAAFGFVSPPFFSVLHGRKELGFVDELTFLGKQKEPGSCFWGAGLASDPPRLAAAYRLRRTRR